MRQEWLVPGARVSFELASSRLSGVAPGGTFFSPHSR